MPAEQIRDVYKRQKVHIANEKVLGNWVTVEFKIDFTTRQNFTCIYNNREHIAVSYTHLSPVFILSIYLSETGFH